MQLKLGGKYRTRRGDEIVTIIREHAAGYWPFEADNSLSYTAEGYWAGEHKPDDEDLVEEVREAIQRAISFELESAPVIKYSGPLIDVACTDQVLDEIFEERERQERKWGVQNHHPNYWLPILMEEVGEVARALCEAHATKHQGNDNEENWANYREELVQVAAVACAMVESYDRNKYKGDKG